MRGVVGKGGIELQGFPVALGLFFFAAALQNIQVRTGLIVMTTVVTGYAIARISAVAIAGTANHVTRGSTC